MQRFNQHKRQLWAISAIDTLEPKETLWQH
jgi:hypothetical protein